MKVIIIPQNVDAPMEIKEVDDRNGGRPIPLYQQMAELIGGGCQSVEHARISAPERLSTKNIAFLVDEEGMFHASQSYNLRAMFLHGGVLTGNVIIVELSKDLSDWVDMTYPDIVLESLGMLFGDVGKKVRRGAS